MTIREILERLSSLPGFEQWEYDGEAKFSELSTGSLRDLYESIRRALDDDDGKVKPEQRSYRVRDTRDWREWAAAIEDELDKRGEKFEKIAW